MVSFDVENCFGSIPVSLAIEIIERDFDSIINKHTNIQKGEFINLLKFCLCECNFFTYENRTYRQLLGMFMGSCLAPILVERIIEDTITKTLQSLDFDPLFWMVYVDDHITSIPTNKIKIVLDKLNSFHPLIKFTHEIEENNRINFIKKRSKN